MNTRKLLAQGKPEKAEGILVFWEEQFWPKRPFSYILGEDHVPVPVDRSNWDAYMEQCLSREGWRVAEDTVGDVRVSTVFLGLDHDSLGPVPILFETMTFGGSDELDICNRYATWAEAEAGHQQVVEIVRKLGSVSDDQQPI